MRGGRLRLDHPLGDLLPHRRHRLDGDAAPGGERDAGRRGAGARGGTGAAAGRAARPPRPGSGSAGGPEPAPGAAALRPRPEAAPARHESDEVGLRHAARDARCPGSARCRRLSPRRCSGRPATTGAAGALPSSRRAAAGAVGSGSQGAGESLERGGGRCGPGRRCRAAAGVTAWRRIRGAAAGGALRRGAAGGASHPPRRCARRPC